MDIEVKEYNEPGYSPVIDFESWRVAVLNDIDELEIPNLKTMQKHLKSDEVFVLMKGKVILFTAGNKESVGTIRKTILEPGKCYNVKAGVWHTHTLEKNSSALIIENRNTGDENSPTIQLSDDQILELRSCAQGK
jgi:ureidoglycolate hydrolase